MTYSYSIGTEYPIDNNEEVSDWITQNVDFVWNTQHNGWGRESPSMLQMQLITYQFPDIKFYLYYCRNGDLEVYELYKKKVTLVDRVERESETIVGGEYMTTEVEAYPDNTLFA